MLKHRYARQKLYQPKAQCSNRYVRQKPLNRVLILPNARSRKIRQIPLKILIYKTKTYPWRQNTENIEIRSQCRIFLALAPADFTDGGGPPGGTPKGDPPCCSLIPQRSICCDIGTEIYDIGTEILYFQCFVTTDMFLFCKPFALAGIAAFCEILLLAVSKHILKRSKKSSTFLAQIDLFMKEGD